VGGGDQGGGVELEGRKRGIGLGCIEVGKEAGGEGWGGGEGGGRSIGGMGGWWEGRREAEIGSLTTGGGQEGGAGNVG